MTPLYHLTNAIVIYTGTIVAFMHKLLVYNCFDDSKVSIFIGNWNKRDIRKWEYLKWTDRITKWIFQIC